MVNLAAKINGNFPRAIYIIMPIVWGAMQMSQNYHAIDLNNLYPSCFINIHVDINCKYTHAWIYKYGHFLF